jgi:iron complex transport system substrate-binding protein
MLGASALESALTVHLTNSFCKELESMARKLLVVFVVMITLAACGAPAAPATPADATNSGGATASPASSATASPASSAAASPAATDSTTTAAASQECVTSYDPNTDYFPDKTEPKYAKEWQVRYEKNYKVVRVDLDTDPAKEDLETYVLVQCGTPAPKLEGDLAGAFTFTIPIKRYWEGGSSLFAAHDALGTIDTLVGTVGEITGGTNQYLPKVAEWVKQEAVIKEASYGEDLELIVSGSPDAYFNTNGREWMTNARNLGIPALHYSPFSESPLGSAEQVKFLSLFYNVEAKANAYLAPIEQAYLELREKAQAQPQKPTVLIGTVRRDGRFGTRNLERLESVLMRDAGGQLALSDKEFSLGGGSEGVGDSIDLELAVEVGGNADYWFNLAYTPAEETAAEFVAANPLNGKFTAMTKGNAFHRFGRAEDYFSTGAVRADQLLMDAVSILHPDLLPDHKLVFLKRIPAQ